MTEVWQSCLLHKASLNFRHLSTFSLCVARRTHTVLDQRSTGCHGGKGRLVVYRLWPGQRPATTEDGQNEASVASILSGTEFRMTRRAPFAAENWLIP